MSKIEQKHFDALEDAIESYDQDAIGVSHVVADDPLAIAGALREIPAMVIEMQSQAERLGRECEIRYHELTAERANREHLIRLLSAIHMRIYPKLITGPDGKAYRFTAPDPHVYLQALADCIRAIPNEIAAETPPQAPAVPDVDELRTAVADVLQYRHGALPNLGYIRDNDKSRAALERLANALAAITSQPPTMEMNDE